MIILSHNRSGSYRSGYSRWSWGPQIDCITQHSISLHKTLSRAHCLAENKLIGFVSDLKAGTTGYLNRCFQSESYFLSTYNFSKHPIMPYQLGLVTDGPHYIPSITPVGAGY
ncbi:uncharacterized protein FTOL_13942 [Fusarium torulosum]|uniref:Uncharacterized protein n=1 Tax=Fusarium torulosum TaxID=33205 RepID=A0AAE8MPG9_9HYPO|nr:uncharacterized protein FTOL_13942 [Fusarium torulosum]